MIPFWPLPTEAECVAYDMGFVGHAFVSYILNTVAHLADGSIAIYPTHDTVESVFRASALGFDAPIAVSVGSYWARTMPVDGVQ